MEIDFEKKLLELEKINEQLNSGSISLEQGIVLFEKSLVLTRECVDYLNKAKGRITQIKTELDRLTDDDE